MGVAVWASSYFKYSFDFKIISCTIVQHSTYVRYRPRWKTKLKHIEIKLTKRCQVTRHVFTSLLINIQEFAWIEVFYEIVDFFVLNVWFNWFSLHALSQKEETHSEPAVHKTNYKFDFQYHSVSLNVQVQVKTSTFTSIS